MIKEIVINSIEELFPLISAQDYREDIDRYRSLYLYRGMPDVNYDLQTSIQRNCKGQKKQLEPSILKNFTKYAALEEPEIEKSVWRQMILGRHYGLPTRLLDWSHSPLVAMHFATDENHFQRMTERDGVIWRIDMAELLVLLPQKYRDMLAKENKTCIFTVDMLDRVAPDIDTYDRDMKDRSMVIIEPPSSDLRIVNQYSFFTIVPDEMINPEDFLEKYTKNTVKYIISREIRWRLRDMLDQINISERIVYPGLDGLSRWLARHYYVKDDN